MRIQVKYRVDTGKIFENEVEWYDILWEII